MISLSLKVLFPYWYSFNSTNIYILIYMLEVILYLKLLIFFDKSEDSSAMKWPTTSKGTKYNILPPNL